MLYLNYSQKILAITKKPVSCEVFADEINNMILQGQKISKWGKNVYVKVPFCNSKGIFCGKIIKELNKKNIELKNKTKSYTYETLKYLKEIYPEQHLSLIIGLDSLNSFTTWKNWENILSLCSLLVLERKLNFSLELNKELESKMSPDYDDFFSGHGKILILKNDLINISSTDVRHKIKNNENLTDLVDDQVLEYISKKSLYKI